MDGDGSAMDDDRSRMAAIRFGRPGAAGRRIAGVAAAARILREVEAAGLARARLLLPAGETLGPRALADIARLAGALRVDLVSGAGDGPGPMPDQPVVRLDGDRLLTARQISAHFSASTSPKLLSQTAANSTRIRQAMLMWSCSIGAIPMTAKAGTIRSL